MEGESHRSAKRTADRQINKDEDASGSAVGDEEPGTFQRASPEVLKQRKIVKARLKPSVSTAAAGSAATAPMNPFASLSNSSPTPQTPASTASNVPTGGESSADAGEKNATASADSKKEEQATTDGALSATVHANGNGNTADLPSILGTPAPTESEGASAEPTKASEVASDDKAGATDVKASSSKGTGESASTEKNGEANGGSSNREGANVSGGAGGSMEPAGASGASATSNEGSAALGVVSFGHLSSASPFKTFATGGASGSASLTFTGFGSAGASSSDAAKGNGTQAAMAGTSATGGKDGTSKSAGNEASKDEGEGASSSAPVLSFGSSSTMSGFASFTSFATAPIGTAWGSLSKIGQAGSNNGEAKAGDSSKAQQSSTKTPLVKGLLDPSEVVNGEELEDCLHKVRAKLYRLKMKEWAEVGIGFLKVLRKNESEEAEGQVTGKSDGAPKDGAEKGGQEGKKDEQTKDESKKGPSARLVMRREAGMQVVLNIFLQPQTRCSKQGEKAVQLVCLTKDGPVTYLIKVKTPEDASSLKAVIDSNIPSETAVES